MESFERERMNEYFSMFLEKRRDESPRTPVFIDKRLLDVASGIAEMLSDGKVAPGDYIDNILEEHLATYGNEIVELYGYESSVTDGRDSTGTE